MKQVTVKGFLLLIAVTLLHGAEVGSGPLKSPYSMGAMDIIGPCRAPAGAAVITRQDSLPRALRDAMKQKLGELVSPSSPFDATDVVQTGHNRRLIFIWSRGNRWVIATEHGGRGYNDPYSRTISVQMERRPCCMRSVSPIQRQSVQQRKN